MRIFQLNTYCGVKSTGRIAAEIAKLVAADGGEARIGYGVPGISEDSRPFAVRVGSPIERKLHAVMRKLIDAEGYGSWFATKALIREMKNFQPDLVHFHNLHGCYLHLPLLFRYLSAADLPVVWTLHDCWPFTGHCAYHDFSGCTRWMSECHHCPSQKNYPVCIGLDGSRRNHRMKKKTFASLSKLTFAAPCEWMGDQLRLSFLGQYPVRTIPNGVNLHVFKPVENDLRSIHHLNDKKICLSVASEWDARKGLDYLCKAAARLKDHCFVVIGLTSEQIAKLPDGMIGIQSTSDVHELAAWYSTADCLVNPTLEDNMPMVNLEALACGTPVVVFETGGCPEAVNASCGIVVSKGDLDGLCAAVQKAASGVFSRDDCIRRASMFDCEQTFQAYLSLYKELCQ